MECELNLQDIDVDAIKNLKLAVLKVILKKENISYLHNKSKSYYVQLCIESKSNSGKRYDLDSVKALKIAGIKEALTAHEIAFDNIKGISNYAQLYIGCSFA